MSQFVATTAKTFIRKCEPSLQGGGSSSTKETIMEIDTQRIRVLLDKRDEIDAELAQALAGAPKKAIKCGTCQQEGHTARTCPQRRT